MDFEALVDGVKTREDLAKFVDLLSRDLRAHTETWENNDLYNFLQALSGWIFDMDGYFHNQGLEEPTDPSWGLVGEMLLAARVYG